MDSKPNKPDSVLTTILVRLRPILLRRWKLASLKASTDVGEHDQASYMAGFQRGYWAGAVDVSQERLTLKDLQSPDSDPVELSKKIG
jgi:hypothetical protein